MKSTRALINFETAYIEFDSNLRIQIQRYDNPVDWEQYCARLWGTADVPSLNLLGLNTEIETTNASKRPPVYIRVGRLGEGAFAEVFKAVERHTANVVAIKLFKPGRERWKEHAVLARLKHDHVVRYVAYNHADGQPAQLVMEYIEGPHLQAVLSPSGGHPPLDMAEIQIVLHQLLQAAAYLHGEGVTHRDIKPANIIVVRRGPVHTKLVDFGLATDADQFDTFCGSPLYVAPELVQRHGPCTNKVDMFSIGVVALTLFGISFDVRRSRHGVRRGARPYLDAVLEQRQLLAARARPLPAHIDLGLQLLADRPDRRPSARTCLGHVFFAPDALAAVGVNTTAAGGLHRRPLPDPATQIFRPDHDWALAGHTTEEMATEDAAHAQSAQGPSGRARLDASQPQPAPLSLPLSAHDERQYKRQKKTDSHVSGSRRSALARSGAPSPLSRRGDHSSGNLMLGGHGGQEVQDGQNEQEEDYSHDWDGWLDNGNHSVTGARGNAAPFGSDVPDTASGTSASHHESQPCSPRTANIINPGPVTLSAKGTSLGKTPTDESSSPADLYDGCWLDPLHALGNGGSFLSGHRRTRNTIRDAARQPPSDTTPSFRSLWGRDELEDQDIQAPGADGAARGPQEGEPSAVDGAEQQKEAMGGEEALDRTAPSSEPSSPVAASRCIPTEPRTPDDEEHEEDGAAVEDASVPRALVINGCPVATDDGEGRVSLRDVCEAAKTTGMVRLRYFYLFQGRGVVVQRSGQSWLPLRDGCFLCEALGLDPHPLLSRSALDPAILLENYLLLRQPLPPQYSVLWWKGTAVFYAPSACEINLTSLAKACGKNRTWVQGMFHRNRHVAKTIVRGSVQGTYVAVGDAYPLCAANGLDMEPVHAIAARCGLVPSGSCSLVPLPEETGAAAEQGTGEEVAGEGS